MVRAGFFSDASLMEGSSSSRWLRKRRNLCSSSLDPQTEDGIIWTKYDRERKTEAPGLVLGTIGLVLMVPVKQRGDDHLNPR